MIPDVLSLISTSKTSANINHTLIRLYSLVFINNFLVCPIWLSFLKCGQPIVDHLFFDHLKSVFFNSTMLTFYNNVRWNFLHIRLMLQMMPPPLSFFFFYSCCLSPTATPRLRDEWWVDSLFLLLWLLQRDFCSLFLLLWLSFRNFRWIFCEERLAQKDTWKSKFAAATFEPSILITFLPWKIFCWYRGLNLGLLPYHVFDAFTVNQHWCRHENQRLVALDVT